MLQITDLAKGFTSFAGFLAPDWKNCVMKYTCPTQVPMTKNILSTDIHVCVLAED